MKITANQISDKELIFKIYEELIQLSSSKNLDKNTRRGSLLEQTLFQRHTDGEQVHEKILNITNYHGNANQNHNVILPHIY